MHNFFLSFVFLAYRLVLHLVGLVFFNVIENDFLLSLSSKKQTNKQANIVH